MELDYSVIGKRIKEYRKKNKITQAELAEMVDLSVSYMGAIERGKKLPKLKVFISIANALKVSSDVLLSGVLDVGNQIIASELSKELSGLSKLDQIRIFNVLRTMIDNIG